MSGNSNRSTCCYCSSATFAQWICKQETLFFLPLKDHLNSIYRLKSRKWKKSKTTILFVICSMLGGWHLTISAASNWSMFKRTHTRERTHSRSIDGRSIVRVWVRLCVGNRVEIVSKHLCICVRMCDERDTDEWITCLGAAGDLSRRQRSKENIKNVKKKKRDTNTKNRETCARVC